MGWNYRIAKRIYKTPEPEEEFFILEIWYDKNGNINGWSEIEWPPHGPSLEVVRTDLELMLKAFDEPIVNMEDYE